MKVPKYLGKYGKLGIEIFILLSVLTYIVAFILYEDHHPLAALAVLVISPFPCPGPEPC